MLNFEAISALYPFLLKFEFTRENKKPVDIDVKEIYGKVTTTTEESASTFEEVVCSQENEPGTHNSVRQIAPLISISKSSVHRLIKKKNLHYYKRLKTPQMNSACRKRRAEHAGKLLQHFSIHSLTRLLFQDEKDFSLQVTTNRQNSRVYFNDPKKDVQPERLYSEENKYLKKVMVSAVITWKGVSQPFFISERSLLPEATP